MKRFEDDLRFPELAISVFSTKKEPRVKMGLVEHIRQFSGLAFLTVGTLGIMTSSLRYKSFLPEIHTISALVLLTGVWALPMSPIPKYFDVALILIASISIISAAYKSWLFGVNSYGSFALIIFLFHTLTIFHVPS